MISLMLNLEKIKRPEDQQYLVYTYVLSPERGNVTGYFIPLYVTSSSERAEDKAKEIIETTGYKDILTYPMGIWMSLGESTSEKIIPVEVRENLKEFAKEEDKRIAEMKKERKRIEEEVQAEQHAIQDSETIESYYYDWYCAVQNKAHVDAMKESMKKIEEAYQTRINNIRDKNIKYPDHASRWKDLIKERLSRRGETRQAESILEAAEKIACQENI